MMYSSKIKFLASLNTAFHSEPEPGSGDFFCSCFANKMSGVLRQRVSGMQSPLDNVPVPVIFQVKTGCFAETEKDRREAGECDVKALRLIHGYGVSLTPSQIHLLLRSPKVDYVTLDACVEAATSSASPGGSQSGSECTVFPFDTGLRPLGIALLDSMLPEPARLASDAIRLTLDFTGSGENGQLRPAASGSLHAAEVAETILADYRMGGLAGEDVSLPALDVIALQVVGEDNCGVTSDLIRAIDWVIENRDEFGIRIANLSLSHPPFESHLQDPLCQAVRKMVEAGVITIVSSHKPDERYSHGVGSPGMEPSAITVTTADPSARERGLDSQYGRATGPDRGYKPDLFVDNQPRGDSLAAATVSAVVARMLAVNNFLTPTMVKSILLSTGSHEGRALSRLDARMAVYVSNKLLERQTTSQYHALRYR